MEAARWRRCSSCKGDIGPGETYWICNVSTCNRSRTALAFCSVSCWDVHLSVVNHRESWAVERKAPGADEATPDAEAADRPARRILVKPPETAARRPDPLPRENLIVASKLKAYVLARSGFHTSDRSLEPLSDAVREICDRAIEKARAEGRKTVLERDFE